MIPPGLDESVVRAVVDDFCAKARRDPLVGPVSDGAIPDADWPQHLAVITDFWSSMLLGAGLYHDCPMISVSSTVLAGRSPAATHLFALFAQAGTWHT